MYQWSIGFFGECEDWRILEAISSWRFHTSHHKNSLHGDFETKVGMPYWRDMHWASYGRIQLWGMRIEFYFIRKVINDLPGGGVDQILVYPLECLMALGIWQQKCNFVTYCFSVLLKAAELKKCWKVWAKKTIQCLKSPYECFRSIHPSFLRCKSQKMSKKLEGILKPNRKNVSKTFLCYKANV